MSTKVPTERLDDRLVRAGLCGDLREAAEQRADHADRLGRADQAELRGGALRAAAHHRVDDRREIALVIGGADRGQRGAVGGLGVVGRGIEIQRELLDLAGHQRAIRVGRGDQRLRRARIEAQTLLAGEVDRHPVGGLALGQVGGKGERVRRAQRDLHELGVLAQIAGDEDDAIAGRAGPHQRLDRFHHVVGRRIDADMARAAEQRDRGGFVGEQRRIGLELAARQIDPLGIGAERLVDPRSQRARTRFIRAIEQDQARGGVGLVERARDLARVSFHLGALRPA